MTCATTHVDHLMLTGMEGGSWMTPCCELLLLLHPVSIPGRRFQRSNLRLSQPQPQLVVFILIALFLLDIKKDEEKSI